jgi:hypothetical protein
VAIERTDSAYFIEFFKERPAMSSRLLTVSTLTLCLGSPLAAQNVLSGDHVVTGTLCVGSQCPVGFQFGFIDIQIDDFNPILAFEDKSGATLPNQDYAFFGNPYLTENSFVLKNMSTNTDLLYLSGEIPSTGIHLSGSGFLGLGTTLPATNLHVVSNTSSAGIRLEEGSGTPYEWQMEGNDSRFVIRDEMVDTVPFWINAGAPSDSIHVLSTGDVGLGTGTPEGKLHTKGPGVQLAYFESSDGNAVQVRFRTDSVNRRFLAVNNANEVKSQIVFGDDQIQFLGQTIANEWLTISDAGIISSGPSCSASPCDLTFDPEYFTVPPIEERAAYMWENMHLPAVGPTGPDQPFNVTEKMGGVIHELEVAHIYIEQLHERLKAEAADKAIMRDEIAQLAARLEAVEAH